jgi:hypothetical protein
MDEVDEVLDRLSAEVSERDARIAELEAQLGESGRLHDSGEDRPLGDALT